MIDANLGSLAVLGNAELWSKWTIYLFRNVMHSWFFFQLLRLNVYIIHQETVHVCGLTISTQSNKRIVKGKISFWRKSYYNIFSVCVCIHKTHNMFLTRLPFPPYIRTTRLYAILFLSRGNLTTSSETALSQREFLERLFCRRRFIVAPSASKDENIGQRSLCSVMWFRGDGTTEVLWGIATGALFVLKSIARRLNSFTALRTTSHRRSHLPLCRSP